MTRKPIIIMVLLLSGLVAALPAWSSIPVYTDTAESSTCITSGLEAAPAHSVNPKIILARGSNGGGNGGQGGNGGGGQGGNGYGGGGQGGHGNGFGGGEQGGHGNGTGDCDGDGGGPYGPQGPQDPNKDSSPGTGPGPGPQTNNSL